MSNQNTYIYLLRHGSYTPHKELDFSPLSQEGKEKQHDLFHRMQDSNYTIDQIYTSPLKRAKETSQILSTYFPKPLSVTEALNPELFIFKNLFTLLKSNINTAFVGHDPVLSNFAQQLCHSKELPYSLSKSSALILSFADIPEIGKANFISYLR
jgi:phosphohistidine phosphatase SixA